MLGSFLVAKSFILLQVGEDRVLQCIMVPIHQVQKCITQTKSSQALDPIASDEA